MDRLPCPSYAIPGNHDSYPNEVWKNLFGYERQFETEIGDAVFLMADTFQSSPAKGASGSPTKALDADYLRRALRLHRGKKIFLCAHYLSRDLLTDDAKELIKESPDLICLFRGHTHVNGVLNLDADCGGKTLIDIGGYGYKGMQIDQKWIFSHFDFAFAWGYQILEWDDHTVHTYHVKPTMHYVGSNGVFDVEETVSGERTFTVNQ